MTKNADTVVKSGLGTTVLLVCGKACRNAFQDKLYGGKRLHNKTASGHRCTVCGSDR